VSWLSNSLQSFRLRQKNEKYDEKRCKAFVCDLTVDPLVDNVPRETVDIVSFIFVLSAISPEKMKTAVRNIKQASDWTLTVLAMSSNNAANVSCRS